MKDIVKLLENLTELIPPGTNQNHSIILGDEHELMVQLMCGSRFFPFGLTRDDLDKNVDALALEISALFLKEVFHGGN